MSMAAQAKFQVPMLTIPCRYAAAVSFCDQHKAETSMLKTSLSELPELPNLMLVRLYILQFAGSSITLGGTSFGQSRVLWGEHIQQQQRFMCLTHADQINGRLAFILSCFCRSTLLSTYKVSSWVPMAWWLVSRAAFVSSASFLYIVSPACGMPNSG